ncbi:MAG: universal stress protein [Steroidobacterales bacterium]
MHSYRKILVLLDLSDASAQVATAARDMAAGTDAQIVALHIVEFIPVEPMGETLMPAVQIQSDLAVRARERLADMARDVGLQRARCRVEIGNTKAQILRVAAEEAADLIVLGSRERHGLAILVNFTEDTILHASHCDVLAIRLK